MRKISKQFLSIFTRYIILILVAIPNLWLFYVIFTPLTIYSSYFLLSLFFDVSLKENIILISNSLPIEIIEACVAGSAYYLLLVLNLSVPKIKFDKRIMMIFLSFLSLFILNVIRIALLSFLFIKGVFWFDTAHKLFWYAGSIIFVLGIWFAEVRSFKIKKIPVYSDMKFLFKKTKRKY